MSASNASHKEGRDDMKRLIMGGLMLAISSRSSTSLRHGRSRQEGPGGGAVHNMARGGQPMKADKAREGLAIATALVALTLGGCGHEGVRPDPMDNVAGNPGGVMVFHYVGWMQPCDPDHLVKNVALRAGAGYLCMETRHQFHSTLSGVRNVVAATPAAKTIHIGHSRGGVIAVRMGALDPRTHHVFNLMGGWGATAAEWPSFAYMRPAKDQTTTGTWWYGEKDTEVPLRHGEMLCARARPLRHVCKFHMSGHGANWESQWTGWTKELEAKTREAVAQTEGTG